MPIYVPGKRAKGRQKVLGAKRNVVAVLQLTAMVDMFTVLVVFLLQNYASTNQVLPMSDEIPLPQASLVKELKPSFVVILSKEKLSFNKERVGSFEDVKNSQDWLIPSLKTSVGKAIEEVEKQSKNKNALQNPAGKIPVQYKMTLQADKDIDFLSIKKVLYTLTEAGVQEINFAVIKVTMEDKYGSL